MYNIKNFNNYVYIYKEKGNFIDILKVCREQKALKEKLKVIENRSKDPPIAEIQLVDETQPRTSSSSITITKIANISNYYNM